VNITGLAFAGAQCRGRAPAQIKPAFWTVMLTIAALFIAVFV
jgi:hypothetical protein